MQARIIKFCQIFIYIFALVFFFNATLRSPLEYDIGWQLRDGQYILTHHAINRTNIFSYEMSGYSWISSSWGLNIIRYLVYNRFSFFGFSLLQAIIATSTLFIFSKAFKLSFWEISLLAPLIFYVDMPINDDGFTGTSVSFLGLAFLFLILRKFTEKEKKFIFLVIPLFLIWANLHGEFFLGYVIFGLWSIFFVLSKNYKNGKFRLPDFKKESKLIIPVLLLSFLVTLINPYGINLYTKEIFQHTGTPMQKVITEWFPFDVFTKDWWLLVAWGVLIITNVFIFIYRKELLKRMPYVAPCLVLLFLSFFMRRYAWPMYLISIPVVYPIISAFKPRIKWLSLLVSFIILAGFYLYVSFRLLPDQYLFDFDWNLYCRNYIGCSIQTATYFRDFVLSHHIPPDKYLTPYDWGGFLIWNFPEIKPTVDGRMPLWKDDKGYSGFEKYYAYERTVVDINQSPYILIYMPKNKPLYFHLVDLVSKRQWRLMDEDATSAIFVREGSIKS